MGSKIVKTIFLLVLALLILTPARANDAIELVRVGITDNNFQNILRQEISLYATAESLICDQQSKRMMINVPADVDIQIKNTLSGLEVKVGENIATLRSFVVVSPSGLIGVRNLQRKGLPAIYHGAFEIVQTPDRKGFYVINLVEMQEYLKGVVPNEMPTWAGLEALKAQAVAARNYVVTPTRAQYFKEFDVVDSVSSQVYFGVNTERDIATQAVMETNGIVALYDNEPILALYSSTAGGYTENYSNAFSDAKTKSFPAISKPYLVAVPDIEGLEALDTEEKARAFYTTKVPSYDIDSPYYRWQREWVVGELENVLKKTLPEQSKTGFVNPVFQATDRLGHIKDIKVMKRGPSGKVIELDLMTTTGCYRVSKELVIRRLFQKDGKSLPSANIVFDKKLDSYGNVTDITVFGGGFGHGVGMSQYGAGHLSVKLKQPYYNILRHYYTGISLGTKPVNVEQEDVTQTFWSPIGRAQLVVVGQVVPKIEITLNGKKHELKLERGFFQKETKVDISRFVEDGQNVITYHPAACPLRLYVEIVEPKKVLEKKESLLDIQKKVDNYDYE